MSSRKYSVLILLIPEVTVIPFFIYSSRSEVSNRVVFGLITWFASPGESSREFVYMYIFIKSPEE